MAQSGKHFFLLKNGGLLNELLANGKDGPKDQGNNTMRKKIFSLKNDNNYVCTQLWTETLREHPCSL